MKQIYRIVIPLILITGASLFILKNSSEKDEESSKKFKTPAEYRGKDSEEEKEREEKETGKPDKPSEFVEHYNRIRTRFGETKPNYQPNYKIKELSKAKNRNVVLKSKKIALNWEERGPGNVSGRTRAMLIDQGDSTRNTWFVGSVSGGIWKTTNAGGSWTNLTPNLPTLSTVCLAQSRSNPQVIYAGTGEGFYNHDAIIGDGIFKSTDNGETWIQLPSTSSNRDFFYVNRIVVDPSNENILLAATNTSIQKSTDGGKTWNRVYDNFRRIQQIIPNPSNFNILFATANTRGVLKSIDAGDNWHYVLDESDGRIELAISPSNPEIMYALTENSQLFVSSDNGESWAPGKISSGNKDLFLSAQGWYNNALAVAPDDPNMLVIGGVNIYKVEIIGASSTPNSFVNVSTTNTEGFMSFVNHGAGYLSGGMEVNLDKTDYSNIEVQFGPGKSQKAHRFKVPDGATSGVVANDYTFLDYVDVPFEVWDITNHRQLMVSFRDQDKNGEFNLTPLYDNALAGREYVWINDVTYTENPSSFIAVNGGHEYEEIAFWWPVLADGAIWDPNNLPSSKIEIRRTTIYAQQLKSTKIADWSAQGAPYVHADNHQVQFTKTDKGTTRIIVTNDGGVGYTDNLGSTWINPTNGYNTTQFYGVDKHPAQNRYIGGLQDNGSWFSNANPNSLSAWNEGTGGDGFDAIWHAIEPNKLISSSYYNDIYLSNDGGETWGYATVNITDEGGNNAPFMTQIGYTPIDPDKLFIVGKSGVTISEDFGQTWNLVEIPESIWGWAGDGFVEPSSINSSVVWAASQMSSKGHVLVSTNGGKSFNETTNFNVEMGLLSGFATHPLNDSIAYALFSYAGYPKILQTRNLGQSWEDISGFSTTESSNGFPDVAVYSLMVMPNNPNEIWAGTEIGLFITTDNGISWNYADNGLPAVAIWEMKIRGTQVIVATHGRGIWTVEMPELSTAIKAPSLLAVGTTPANKTEMSVVWGSTYDSIAIFVDDNHRYSLPPNTKFSEQESYMFDFGLDEGTHRLKVVAYKNKYVLNSMEKSFLTIHYQDAQSNYNNSFDESSNDFIGSGFSIMSYDGLGAGMAIHTNHPYVENENISYYLKTPIVINSGGNSSNSTLKYRDIPCIEEGEAGSAFGSSNFYDYVIVEATINGIDWLPLLKGYDYSLIKLRAAALGKTVDDQPSSFMFTNHLVNLADKFDDQDTIALRFRLFSDPNKTGWGWVIDDINIQSNQETKVDQKQNSIQSIYPVPCNQELTVELNQSAIRNSQLNVFDLQGRKLISIHANKQSKVIVNTSQLPPSTYILEIKSGDITERQKFQVKH